MWWLLLVGCAREPDWRAEVRDWTYPAPIPSVPLVDQHGTAFHLGDYAADHVLIGFVYTRCDVATACPMTMHRLVATDEAWRAEPRDRTLRVLALTLDPAYDTPERLDAFARTHGATFTVATGDVTLLATDLPSIFSILAIRDGDRIDHSTQIVMLRPGLIVDRAWSDDDFTPAAAVAAALE